MVDHVAFRVEPASTGVLADRVNTSGGGVTVIVTCAASDDWRQQNAAAIIVRDVALGASAGHRLDRQRLQQGACS